MKFCWKLNFLAEAIWVDEMRFRWIFFRLKNATHDGERIGKWLRKEIVMNEWIIKWLKSSKKTSGSSELQEENTRTETVHSLEKSAIAQQYQLSWQIGKIPVKKKLRPTSSTAQHMPMSNKNTDAIGVVAISSDPGVPEPGLQLGIIHLRGQCWRSCSKNETVHPEKGG